MKHLSNEALVVLSQVAVNGTLVSLPSSQLDRKLYAEVNGALENFGGKWNRKSQAHVFSENPTDLLDEVVQTGGYIKAKTPAQQLGFFETPSALAERLVTAVCLQPEDRVLESSAGTGNLLRAILASRVLDGDGVADISMTAIEINPAHSTALLALAERFYSSNLIIGDFMASVTTERMVRAGTMTFDAVVMNPPFAKQADIDHVTRALNFLRTGGRLAAIMSSSVLFRTNRKAVEFRELVESKGGTFEALPEGSFQASGTLASTVMLRMTA